MRYWRCIEMNKKLLNAIKSGNTHYFYTNQLWLKKRTEALNRDNNECQSCKKEGRYSKANTVHHIKRLKKFPSLALDINNLLSLCYECHAAEHPENKRYFQKKETFE